MYFPTYYEDNEQMTRDCPACAEAPETPKQTLRQGMFKDMLRREFVHDRLMYGYEEDPKEEENYLNGWYNNCASGDAYFSETLKRVCTGLGWYDVQNSKQLADKLKG